MRRAGRWIASGVMLLLWSPGFAVAEDEVVEAFRAAVEHYRQLPDAKVMALAADETGAAWGWDSGRESIEAAMEGALAVCRQQALLNAVSGNCAVVIIGDALVSSGGGGGASAGQPGEPARSGADASASGGVGATGPTEVVYDEQWVDGRRFLVGSNGVAQVWVNVSEDARAEAVIYVVNAWDRPLEFDPGKIRGSYWKRAKPSERSAVTPYTADEWVRKIKSQQAFAAAMAGLAAGLNSVPQPQTTYYQGQANAWGTGGHAYGTYSGTITTWPTWQDYANAQARSQAQLQAVGQQLRSSYEQATANLLQHHTLPAGGYYGGVVHFRQKIRGERAYLRVPFAGEIFEFEFDVPRR